VLGRARGGNAPAPVEAFKEHGVDFIVERDLGTLVRRMNELAGEPLLDETAVEALIAARDREVDSDVAHDEQLNAVRSARHYIGDRLIRTAKPHRILDPANGPLVAVRLSVVTRKTLGGLHTDLSARVLDQNGDVIPGLFAAGEIAGFGGGGMHGYRALEGTFLGGCIFSGRAAGRSSR
jgi:predicted oxidoreductase